MAAESGTALNFSIYVRIIQSCPVFCTRYGATVTLSAPNDKVYVWENEDRSGEKFIHATRGAYTWVLGVDAPPPTTVYVEAIGASAEVGDVVLALQNNDAGATPPPTNPTSNTATTVPASDLKVVIYSNSGDITGRTRDWLIGQRAKLDATVEGPAGIVADATFTWEVPGDVLFDYVIDSDSATTVPLGNDHVIEPSPGEFHHVGKAQRRVEFFWASTSDPGPDLETVKVTPTVPGSGVEARDTKFNVFSPTATVSEPAHGSVIIANLGAGNIELTFNNPPWGIIVGAKVEQPAGFDDPGQWTFLQLVNANDEYDHWQNDGTVDRYLWSRNGSWVLDGSFPPSSQLILDANLQPQGASVLPTGPTVYNWADAPGDTLALNGVHVGIGSAGGPDLHEVRRSDQYKLYVMYRPLGNDSDWVPLKVLNWSWAVDAKDPNKDLQWQIVSVTNPASTGWQRATSEPTWNAVYQSGSWVKQ